MARPALEGIDAGRNGEVTLWCLYSGNFGGGMDKSSYKLQPPMRLFFAVTGIVIWIGIGLTGFAVVNWILYIPAVFFLFAALTGICPGIIISQRVLSGTRR